MDTHLPGQLLPLHINRDWDGQICMKIYGLMDLPIVPLGSEIGVALCSLMKTKGNNIGSSNKALAHYMR